MALTKIDLGKGQAAYIRDEITVGQAEDFTFMATEWIGETASAIRGATAYAIVFVERFEGFDGLEWPQLDEVSVDSPSVSARYQSIRRHLTLEKLRAIIDEVDKRLKPSEQLEGN
jgi:hypothetical protein